jgi:D-cysteine desulfhydrase
MNLAKFPRRRYTEGPTPLERLPNLTKLLHGPQLYMKRDDLLGLAGGGNKTRKLEFLVADALANGADTLITCGAAQSNHCRLTLAAANKEGLNCRLVLEESESDGFKPQGGGNHFLFHLLGAEKIWVVPGGSDMMQAMAQVANDLEAQGRKAYIIPGGGSNPIGATGYVACAEEILSQAFHLGIPLTHIVCTSGSAGTQAGLVTGFYGNNANLPVIGINISRNKEVQENLVYDLAQKTAIHLGMRGGIPREAIFCIDNYVGPGYALPTPKMVEAVRFVARMEAILLDPVYTGKSMAGLIGLIQEGFFTPEDQVLFIHTGGSPALYAYQDIF